MSGDQPTHTQQGHRQCSYLPLSSVCVEPAPKFPETMKVNLHSVILNDVMCELLLLLLWPSVTSFKHSTHSFSFTA